MIKNTMAIALAMSATAAATSASAATIVQSLDTNSSWTVTNSTTNATTNAIVPANVPSIYDGDDNNSPTNGAQWIYPSVSGNEAQNTTFAFTKVFSLAGAVNAASAILSGTFWSDNGIVSILLNGETLFGPISGMDAGNAPTTSFSGTGTAAPSGTSNFVYGTNTLVFNIRNGAGTNGNPVALKGDLAVTAAVPEPGTWMLMLLGFGAIGFAMRSRSKTRVRFQFA